MFTLYKNILFSINSLNNNSFRNVIRIFTDKVYLAKDIKGNIYGSKKDPITGDFYECVGGLCSNCGNKNGIENNFFMYMERKNFLKKFPKASKECLGENCKEDFSKL